MTNMNGQRIAGIALSVVALAAVVYHMLAAYVMLQQFVPLLNTHLAFCFVMVFLSAFIKAKGIGRFWCLVLLFLSLIAVIYVQIFWEDMQMRAFFNTPVDLIIGVLLIALVLEGTRQSFGYIMPVIVIIVIIYPFFGHFLPGPFCKILLHPVFYSVQDRARL